MRCLNAMQVLRHMLALLSKVIPRPAESPRIEHQNVHVGP